jgi:23S rRNA pseudouridine2457 synthase
MPNVVLFNKPYDVLTQFRAEGDRQTLADFIHDKTLRVAGRLDRDSEGLLLLTDDGQLNARLTDPRHKAEKTYWVQVEGTPTDDAMMQLARGVMLNDGITLPARVERLVPAPNLWPRQPPVRFRAHIPTTWLAISIKEGRNRQVRRMTAAIGHPTLRLVRVAIGPYQLEGLPSGEFRSVAVASVRGVSSATASSNAKTGASSSGRSNTGADKAATSADAPRRNPRNRRLEPSERSARAERERDERRPSSDRSRNNRRSNLPIGPRGK